jgi:stage V sporulation protein R
MDRELKQLEKAIEEIWTVAERHGLDPFPVHFEVVPPHIMYEFGAYGLPGRFSHWTHGKAYYRMKTQYDYGLSKIYELVVNNNPAYAFLMDNNTLIQNKLVIAHVLAHSDFFKNNIYFSRTNRQMMETVAVNADRIRRYEYEHGTHEVEEFLDAVLSIQEHVDPHWAIKKGTASGRQHKRERRATPYDDLFELDPDYRLEDEPEPDRFPPEPEKDLLRFISEHSPVLKDWQRDIVDIVRYESLYFVPQMQTKIMNEGWASYWHLRIMRELDLSDAEYAEFAQLHAGVVAPSRTHLNPYYVGMKIFEVIERRWDNPTPEERAKYKRMGGQGRQKIFEVREQENDVSFIRNYLTRDLVEELDLYVYELRDGEAVIVEKDWEKVRDILLQGMVNFGNPYIVVQDGDYRGNRELYLKHQHEGQDLDIRYAEKTLQYVYRLWGRAVHLETVYDGKRLLLTYDGQRNFKSLL